MQEANSERIESSRGVLRCKALIQHTLTCSGSFWRRKTIMDQQDGLLWVFYDRNGIEKLYEIDDAEY